MTNFKLPKSILKSTKSFRHDKTDVDEIFFIIFSNQFVSESVTWQLLVWTPALWRTFLIAPLAPECLRRPSPPTPTKPNPSVAASARARAGARRARSTAPCCWTSCRARRTGRPRRRAAPSPPTAATSELCSEATRVTVSCFSSFSWSSLFRTLLVSNFVSNV